jgi:hypothetical protein
MVIDAPHTVRCGKSRPLVASGGPRHPFIGLLGAESNGPCPGLRAEIVAEIHGQIPSLLNLSPTSEL